MSSRPDRERTAPAVLVRGVRDVARLALPVACPGCRTPDVRWCADCVAVLDAPPWRCEATAPRLDRLDDVDPLPVWALAGYAGGLRDVVVAWKDRGRADLDAPLRAAARRAGERLRPVLASGPVLVAAAPTSRAARRTRGRDPVAGLAAAFAAGLGAPARTARVLGQRGLARDQVGLGSRARGDRLRAVELARGPRVRRALGAAPSVLLVDDVLTTGATLAACETALARAGIPVLGAFVLAATPSPRSDP